MDYKEAQRQYVRFKTRLTRALNTKDAHKILAEVKYFRDNWPSAFPYPDSWHRWQIAGRDAHFALLRQGETSEWIVL